MLDNRNILLYPFSLIYGLITGTRNILYDTGLMTSSDAGLPVICVGNITVGGTGKTPHTEYLAEMLSKHFRVAVLSRGYRRERKGFVMASQKSQVKDIGDEPLQIIRKLPGITLAVDGNRIRGIKEIRKAHPETDLIILDDGFQHRKLNPGFSILLTEFGRLMTRDNLIPYGSLREKPGNAKRADVIIVTKTPPYLPAIDKRLITIELNPLPSQHLFFSTLSYGKPIPVFRQEATDINLAGAEAVLVTGIANPAPLVRHIRSLHCEIIHNTFPDHHNFTNKDIDSISSAFSRLKGEKRYIITTEKDSVRLREFSNIADELKRVFFYIPVEAEFLDGQKEKFDNLIIDYVRENKRNS